MAKDRDVIIDALEEVQRIVADHFEPGALQHAGSTIHRLAMVLNRPDVAAALQRMKARGSLRVLK